MKNVMPEAVTDRLEIKEESMQAYWSFLLQVRHTYSVV